MVNWVGVSAGLDATKETLDYIEGKKDKASERKRQKRADERTEETHGLNVKRGKQQMKLAESQEGRAGERHLRAVRDSDEAYGRTQAENEEWRNSAGLRKRQDKAQTRAAENRAAANGYAASIARMNHQIAQDGHRVRMETERLVAAGRRDEAAVMAETAGRRVAEISGRRDVATAQMYERDPGMALAQLREGPNALEGAYEFLQEGDNLYVLDQAGEYVSDPRTGERFEVDLKEARHLSQLDNIETKEMKNADKLRSRSGDIWSTQESVRKEYDTYRKGYVEQMSTLTPEERQGLPGGGEPEGFGEWAADKYYSPSQWAAESKVEAKATKMMSDHEKKVRRFTKNPKVKKFTDMNDPPEIEVPDGFELGFAQNARHPLDQTPLDQQPKLKLGRWMLRNPQTGEEQELPDWPG